MGYLIRVSITSKPGRALPEIASFVHVVIEAPDASSELMGGRQYVHVEAKSGVPYSHSPRALNHGSFLALARFDIEPSPCQCAGGSPKEVRRANSSSNSLLAHLFRVADDVIRHALHNAPSSRELSAHAHEIGIDVASCLAAFIDAPVYKVSTHIPSTVFRMHLPNNQALPPPTITRSKDPG